jgi:osmotically-inducible protein OsmY
MRSAALLVVLAVSACSEHGTRGSDSSESDAGLRRAVEALIASNPTRSIAAKNVGVAVAHGKVTLSGSVESDRDRRRVEETVRRTPAVVSVIDDVAVSAARDRDDHESDRRIAEAIRNDVHGDAADQIHVRVRHGLVTITGRVPREEDAQKVVEIADTTPGVAATDDEIERPAQRGSSHTSGRGP